MLVFSCGVKSLEKLVSPLGILKDLDFRTKKGRDRIAACLKIRPWRGLHRRKLILVNIGSFFYTLKVLWESVEESRREDLSKEGRSPWFHRKGDHSVPVDFTGDGSIYENCGFCLGEE